MKKLLIILIIAVALVAIAAWFFAQDSHVGVYVTFSTDTENSTIQATQEQFKTATDSRLNLECVKEEIVNCHGTYTVDNFVQLVRYQNSLFNIAKAENLEFGSFVDGVFIAKWLD